MITFGLWLIIMLSAFHIVNHLLAISSAGIFYNKGASVFGVLMYTFGILAIWQVMP